MKTHAVDSGTLDDIVIKWEQEYDDYLNDIKMRMGKGRASKAEIFEIENLERIVLIYELMMKNVIEQHGFWHHEGGPLRTEIGLKILSDRISRFFDADQRLLRTTLEQASKQGDLSHSAINGTIRWEWVDYLN